MKNPAQTINCVFLAGVTGLLITAFGFGHPDAPRCIWVEIGIPPVDAQTFRYLQVFKPKEKEMLTTFQKDVTLTDVIHDHVRFSPPLTPKNLMPHWEESGKKALEAKQDLWKLLEVVGIQSDWEPEPEIIHAQIGQLDFDQAKQTLEEKHLTLMQSIADRFIREMNDGAEKFFVGRIEWPSKKSCRFYGFEDGNVRKTLFNKHTDRVRYSHDLVNAKQVRLHAYPDELLPKPAKSIIRATALWLQKWCYIAVGDRIVKEVEIVGSTTERTAAGRFVDGVVRNRGKVAAAAGVTAGVGILAAIGHALATAATVATAVVADPALVIGNEYALFGWD